MFAKKGLFVLVLLGAITAAVSAAEPVITIVNNTGYTGYFLYVSRSTETTWNTDDLLGNDLMGSGTSIRIPLSSAGIWDFMLVDEDGDSYTKMNYSVRDGSRIEFTFDDFVVSTAAAALDNTVVTVVNNTGYTGYFLYASRSSETSWNEDDFLGQDVLASGTAIRIFLPAAGVWDFKLVDSDGDSYTKMNYSVRDGSRVEFIFDDIE
jgi:hypothetical protein